MNIFPLQVIYIEDKLWTLLIAKFTEPISHRFMHILIYFYVIFCYREQKRLSKNRLVWNHLFLWLCKIITTCYYVWGFLLLLIWINFVGLIDLQNEAQICTLLWFIKSTQNYNRISWTIAQTIGIELKLPG